VGEYGKEHDQLTSLSYYGFRFYDRLTLTWTQADPLYRLVPDLAWDEPRRANLYSFSLNNPLRYIDPDWLEGYDQTYSRACGVTAQGTTFGPAPEPSGGWMEQLSDFAFYETPAGAILTATYEHGPVVGAAVAAYEVSAGTIGVAVNIASSLVQDVIDDDESSPDSAEYDPESLPGPGLPRIHRAPDVVTANGQRATADGTRITGSGHEQTNYSNSSTRKKAIDGAKAQGSGRIATDKANPVQPKHHHAVDQKGRRIRGPKKTHWNKRGDKPSKPKPPDPKPKRDPSNRR
jgi:RHS repeat-associated protein